MEISQYAPVLIPTLNRYIHFKRCIESLSSCTHAEKTNLFIALDYPRTESHWKGYEKIKGYLPQITGFKSINIIERQINFNARNNIVDARKMIFNNYDRIILSEDDNEFSPNFLDYINKGLDKFEDDKDVIAVCGYLYPLKKELNSDYNYFYGKAFSAWGNGAWKAKQLHSDPYSEEELVNIIKNPSYRKKIKYYDQRKFYLIKSYIRNKIVPYGDRSIVIDIIINDKYCIFPTVSKVRNYGNDGTGVHCNNKGNDIFKNQVIDSNPDFNYSRKNTREDRVVKNMLRQYFRLGTVRLLKKIVYNIFFRML
jgi:hypothetical protein